MALQTINRGTTANDGTGDDARTWADKSNANFTYLENLIGSIASEVENAPYANMAALYADQANQNVGKIQYVLDASAHPDVSTAEARHFEYLGTTVGDYTDYRLLSYSESTALTNPAAYRTFLIEALQDDGTPLTTVSTTKISFEYNGVNVTGILFNANFSIALANFYNTNCDIQFYNITKGVIQKASVLNTAWTTVNTDYYRIEITPGDILLSDLAVNDRVEFFIVAASSGGGDTHYHRKVIAIADNTAAPPTEVNGDRYILDETGGGVHANWDGASANDIVEFNGTTWEATTPEEGDKAYVDSEDKDARFIDDGTPQWELIAAGSGSSTPVSKTGTTITFVDAVSYYNEITPLTSGNLTVNRAGALKGALSIVDADKYAPNITLSSGELFYLNGIKPDATAYNVITLEEKISHVLVSVNKIFYLNQPENFLATPQDEALLITFEASENAESYDVYYGTTDVFANATLAGNITVLLLLIESLTNGTEYYVWVIAKGKGFKNSIPLITSGTPAPAVVSNTFIEGKGVSITTASALATLLGINEADINGFNLNGNDIDCEIVVDYSLPADVFMNDAEIVRFRDLAGKLINTSAANVFENADSLLSVEIQSDLPLTPDVNGCLLLEKLDFPNCTGILSSARNCPELYIINGLFTSIGGFGLQGANKLSTIYFPSVTSLSNNAIYEVSNQVYISLPNVTTIPYRAFYNCPHANSVIRLDGATSISSTQAFFRVDAKRIYIGNVTSIGDPTTDQLNFQNAGGGAGIIYVDPVLMTNNAGGLDADLVAAQSYGATIVSCINKTAPEAISDLSATAVSGGSCDLSFTLPNTTNALEYYEVWVDKNDDKGWQVLRPTDEITASGDTISTVAVGDKIKLYACDIYANRSQQSNIITLV